MLNLQPKGPTLDYKIFPEEGLGRITDQIPKLIAEGRTPLSVHGLMKRRLELADSTNRDLIDLWLIKSFCTGDAVLYHPDGKIRIDLDSQLVRELNPNSRLKEGGALILPEGTYESADGPEFYLNDLEKYGIRKWLGAREIVVHPVWQTLARDSKLLYSYARIESSFGRETAMGVSLNHIQDVPTMEPCFMTGIDTRSGVCTVGLSSKQRIMGSKPRPTTFQKLRGMLFVD